MSDSNETKEWGDSLADFIGRHRKAIVIAGLLAALGVAAVASTVAIREKIEERAIVRVEDLGERYEALLPVIRPGGDDGTVTELLADITLEAERSFGYAGARAWYLAGSLEAERENWAAAESAFLKAARKAGKSYLAPAALFNAGAAAEGQGNAEAAIAHYRDAAARPDFPQAARALFSAGRLEEGRKEGAAAVETYRTVTEKWPSTPWANLAQSRILALGIAE